MSNFKVINDLFSKINHYTFQYEDGYFMKVSSFHKEKNKPNKLYKFNASMKYCKCCNVLLSVSFTVGNTVYYWSPDSEDIDKSKVNFDENINFRVLNFNELLLIMKENINV